MSVMGFQKKSLDGESVGLGGMSFIQFYLGFLLTLQIVQTPHSCPSAGVLVVV